MSIKSVILRLRLSHIRPIGSLFKVMLVQNTYFWPFQHFEDGSPQISMGLSCPHASTDAASSAGDPLLGELSVSVPLESLTESFPSVISLREAKGELCSSQTSRMDYLRTFPFHPPTVSGFIPSLLVSQLGNEWRRQRPPNWKSVRRISTISTHTVLQEPAAPDRRVSTMEAILLLLRVPHLKTTQ